MPCPEKPGKRKRGLPGSSWTGDARVSRRRFPFLLKVKLRDCTGMAPQSRLTALENGLWAIQQQEADHVLYSQLLLQFSLKEQPDVLGKPAAWRPFGNAERGFRQRAQSTAPEMNRPRQLLQVDRAFCLYAIPMLGRLNTSPQRIAFMSSIRIFFQFIPDRWPL